MKLVSYVHIDSSSIESDLASDKNRVSQLHEEVIYPEITSLFCRLLDHKSERNLADMLHSWLRLLLLSIIFNVYLGVFNPFSQYIYIPLRWLNVPLSQKM